MAMGTSPAEEHNASVREQLTIQWPLSALSTPETPNIEDREVETDLEVREGE